MTTEWQPLSGNRQRRYLHDGTRCLIGPTSKGVHWEASLPTGQTATGTGPTEAAAKASCDKAHDAYVLAQWAKGEMISQGRFVCPLK